MVKNNKNSCWYSKLRRRRETISSRNRWKPYIHFIKLTNKLILNKLPKPTFRIISLLMIISCRKNHYQILLLNQKNSHSIVRRRSQQTDNRQSLNWGRRNSISNSLRIKLRMTKSNNWLRVNHIRMRWEIKLRYWIRKSMVMWRRRRRYKQKNYSRVR